MSIKERWYMEEYRDVKEEFEWRHVSKNFRFCQGSSGAKTRDLRLFSAGTRHVFFTGFTLEYMVEINSPLWLKAGVYHISCEAYLFEKDRIHEASRPIARYPESGKQKRLLK